MATPGIAAGAYASIARLGEAAGLSRTIGDGAGGGEKGFSAMLKDVLTSVAEAGRKSDAQTQAVASGKANIVDVVTAVSETEVAIETLVSVRDKVVQAYEDILKMPI